MIAFIPAVCYNTAVIVEKGGALVEESIQFIIKILDLAWFFDVAATALSWVTLARGPVWDWRRPGRTAVEFLLAGAAVAAGQLLIILLGVCGIWCVWCVCGVCGYRHIWITVHVWRSEAGFQESAVSCH